MIKFYCRVVSHNMAPSVAESIYTTVLTKTTPEKQCEWLQAQSAKRYVHATYSVATETEYWAHRARVQAMIVSE